MNYKSGKVLLFPLYILFAACILLVSFSALSSCVRNKTRSVEDYFSLSSVQEFLSSGGKRSEDGRIHLEAVETVLRTGDIEVECTDNQIDSIRFTTTLKEADTDLSDAEAVFSAFVRDVMTKIGCEEFSEPVLIQYCDSETYKNCPSDEIKAVLNGYALMEYSYRDKDGILWISQIYSPADDVVKGMLLKQVNETKFAGFEPQVNDYSGKETEK